MANCKHQLYVPELPKWQQHGWKEEKAYQPDVLIGNWYENRMKVVNSHIDYVYHTV